MGNLCCRSNKHTQQSDEDGPEDYFDYQSKPSLFELVSKDKNDQFPLKIVKKEVMTHDTYLIRLGFGNENWISGLWAGSGHFVFHATING
jgi:cytochrome-b5 reductase